MTEDEVVGWHHRLNEHECEQALGGSERSNQMKAEFQSKVSQKKKHQYSILMHIYDF